MVKQLKQHAMTLIKRNNPGSYFPSVFDDFFTKDFRTPFKTELPEWTSSQPAVNIKETEKGFHIELAAPGLKKEDFKVQLEKNLLTISAEKEVETTEKDKKGNYTRREFGYSSFRRSFTLSDDLIDTENIHANYENGVLALDLPKQKAEKAKATKQISIS